MLGMYEVLFVLIHLIENPLWILWMNLFLIYFNSSMIRKILGLHPVINTMLGVEKEKSIKAQVLE